MSKAQRHSPRPPARDDDLLVAAGRGDLAAMGAFYDRTAPTVYGFLLSELGSPSPAEEAARQVYLQLWRSASRYDPGRCSAYSVLLAAARDLVERLTGDHRPDAGA